MSTVRDTLQTAAEAGIGIKIASAALGAAMAYIAPFQTFLIAIVVLVFADIITGIWAARKRGEPFSSSKLGRTSGKFILYPLAILLAHVMVSTFFAGVPVVDSLTYMVALFISAVEFQSNIENIGKITGIDIWSHVKTWISSRVKPKTDDPQAPSGNP